MMHRCVYNRFSHFSSFLLRQSIHQIPVHKKGSDFHLQLLIDAISLHLSFFQLYIYFENVNLDNVYPWLVTTARNFTFNYNRDKKREILGEVFEVLKETKDKFCNINNMEEYYLRTEQKRRAEELEDSIFECLYKDHRIWYDAVMQVYCFGKSQQEAADQLGIAVEVLNSRLYRARQWIRKNYEKEYEEVVSWF